MHLVLYSHSPRGGAGGAGVGPSRGGAGKPRGPILPSPCAEARVWLFVQDAINALGGGRMRGMPYLSPA